MLRRGWMGIKLGRLDSSVIRLNEKCFVFGMFAVRTFVAWDVT
jgi:hypothetical protein